MKKTAIAVMTTVGLSTALLAGGGGMKQCKHPMNMKHKERGGIYTVMQQLDLTESQKNQLQALRKSQKEKRKAYGKAMKKRRASGEKTRKNRKPDLSRFMTANHFDKETFKALMKKRMEQREKRVKERRDRMVERSVSRMEKIYNILTPEQREKWIELSRKQ
ncbi:MAG: Spy/CpxP family protein refolding chaperone [Sulfurimonas sp.]